MAFNIWDSTHMLLRARPFPRRLMPRVFVQFVMPGRPTSPLAIASKIVLDQTINAPLGTALFFAATKTMEMHPEQVPGTIQVGY